MVSLFRKYAHWGMGGSRLSLEWMACLLLREEMDYSLPSEPPDTPFRAKQQRPGMEVNRFAADWLTLHLFTSLRLLAAQQESAHAFLTSGGMKFAKVLAELKPEQVTAGECNSFFMLFFDNLSSIVSIVACDNRSASGSWATSPRSSHCTTRSGAALRSGATVNKWKIYRRGATPSNFTWELLQKNSKKMRRE